MRSDTTNNSVSFPKNQSGYIHSTPVKCNENFGGTEKCRFEMLEQPKYKKKTNVNWGNYRNDFLFFFFFCGFSKP